MMLFIMLQKKEIYCIYLNFRLFFFAFGNGCGNNKICDAFAICVTDDREFRQCSLTLY